MCLDLYSFPCAFVNCFSPSMLIQLTGSHGDDGGNAQCHSGTLWKDRQIIQMSVPITLTGCSALSSFPYPYYCQFHQLPLSSSTSSLLFCSNLTPSSDFHFYALGRCRWCFRVGTGRGRIFAVSKSSSSREEVVIWIIYYMQHKHRAPS